jgi:hypothetical protein
MSDTQAVEFNLDSSLDDIADLPGFATPPTGVYKVLLAKGMEQKVVADHPAIDMPMTIQEVLEVKPEALNPGEELPKIGDIASTVFMLDNDTGKGKLKEVLKPISAAVGETTVRAILEKTKGLELIVVMKRIQDKKDKDKYYSNIVKLEVA